ncbi:MAG: hypothetical protein CR217_04420 [Beijerinckiaceae bacterium]|nr:MAG: hypothetical protein CR217_04420 [Beijerinckiaceae bacterium]
MGALALVVLGLRSGLVEEFCFGFAADELRRGVFDDGGYVGFDESGQDLARRQRVGDVHRG